MTFEQISRHGLLHGWSAPPLFPSVSPFDLFSLWSLLPISLPSIWSIPFSSLPWSGVVGEQRGEGEKEVVAPGLILRPPSSAFFSQEEPRPHVGSDAHSWLSGRSRQLPLLSRAQPDTSSPLSGWVRQYLVLSFPLSVLSSHTR